MAQLEGKRAAVTGGASGIGRASVRAMLAAGATVAVVDRDVAAMQAMRDELGERLVPVEVDLLDPADCAQLVPKLQAAIGGIDIFHANAGSYIGGDLVEATGEQIDRMLNLNVNVVMKNVRDVLEVMITQGGGDVIVTSSLAAHYPTPWEPVYSSSKWAVDAFVQITRRQVYKHDIRVSAISPGPVDSALVADWPGDRLAAAKADGSLMDADQIGEAIMFMLTRPRGVTVRDMIVMPSNFDL
ncbi:SDR family oxidoreductase [Aestuariimicrobium ganziense]|uniref:SDR family oxidoreductase n=1 Tax=Aestuariimicrobium ganziense TaxID=2773677 RepID=UPI0019412519|nr:SDR family oxidoreductase [Aestuariimicrobium ganziense]